MPNVFITIDLWYYADVILRSSTISVLTWSKFGWKKNN